MPTTFALRRNIFILRIGFRLTVATAMIILSTIVVGCASLASKGLLPEVLARHPPDIQLGAELILIEEPPELVTSLIDTDGVVHLFLIDKDNQLQHIEILDDEIINREILGVIEKLEPWTVLDAIEHPRGKLRVIAGDKQYFHSAHNLSWQEVKGNRCSRFVPIGDELFCAFVIKGEEIGAPERTDYTYGWFLLVPFVFWSHEQASKLVLAQESPNGWIVRAVVDPNTKMDANSDFMVGTDNVGNVHLLYFTSKGGGAFILFAGNYSGGASGSAPEPELRYARLKYNQLLAYSTDIQNQASGNNSTPMQWMTIKGTPLTHKPFVKKDSNYNHAHIVLRPLSKNFSINKATGEVSGLMCAWVCTLDDGKRQLPLLGPDQSWVEVTIRNGQWSPGFNIVTAEDHPTSNYSWSPFEQLIKIDPKGKRHVLLQGLEPAFWIPSRYMNYLAKEDANWSAPLALGSSSLWSYGSLAIDDSGIAFVAWVNEEGKFIGRWIKPHSGDIQ